MSMDISARLRLIDDLTAPARRATGTMRELKRVTESIDVAGRKAAQGVDALSRAYTRLNNRSKAALATMGKMRSRVVGSIFAGAGMAMPIRDAMNLQMQFTRLGQVAQRNAKQMRGFRTEMRRFIFDTAFSTSAPAGQLLDAYGNLLARGMPTRSALGMTGTIGKTSTATGASPEDLSETAFSLWRNLGVLPKHMQFAFGGMAKAGHEGGFELKNMARWYPALTASLGTLMADYRNRLIAQFGPERGREMVSLMGANISAELAGMLQIVRDGAADADQAANNFANVMQKLYLKETAKNFSKYMGVNLPETLKRNLDKGINPVKVVIDLLAKHVEKTGRITDIGHIFGDRQALEGLLPLVNLYRNDRAAFDRQLAALGRSDGLIDRDFKSASRTAKASAQRVWNELRRFNSVLFSIGFGDGLTELFDTVAKGLRTLSGFLRDNSEYVRPIFHAVSALGAGLIALSAARFMFAGLSFGLAGIGMAALTAASGMSALRVVMLPFAGLVGVFSRVSLAFARWGLIAIRAGALAGSIWVAYEGFKLLGGVLDGVAARFAEAFPQAAQAINDFARTAGDRLREWFGYTREQFANIISAARAFGEQLWGGLKWLFTGQGGDASIFDGIDRKWNALTSSIFGTSGTADGARIAGENASQSWLGGWRNWFGTMWDQMWSNSLWDNIKGWSKAGAIALVGSLGAAFMTSGVQGLLLWMMAMRSLVFLLGTAASAIHVLASVAGIFLMPLFETLGEQKWFKNLFAGLWRLLWLGGLLAAGAYLIFRNWKAAKRAISGFWDGVTEPIGKALTKIGEAWNEILEVLFGKAGDGKFTSKELEAIYDQWKEIGSYVGWFIAGALKLFASLLRGIATGLQWIKGLVDGIFGEGAFQKAASAILGIASAVVVAALAFGALRKVTSGVFGLLGFDGKKKGKGKQGFLRRMMGKSVGLAGGLIGGAAGLAGGLAGGAAAGALAGAGARTAAKAQAAKAAGRGRSALRMLGRAGGGALGLLGGPVGFALAMSAPLIIDNWDQIKSGVSSAIDFIGARLMKLAVDINATFASVTTAVTRAFGFVGTGHNVGNDGRGNDDTGSASDHATATGGAGRVHSALQKLRARQAAEAASRVGSVRSFGMRGHNVGGDGSGFDDTGGPGAARGLDANTVASNKNTQMLAQLNSSIGALSSRLGSFSMPAMAAGGGANMTRNAAGGAYGDYGEGEL